MLRVSFPVIFCFQSRLLVLEMGDRDNAGRQVPPRPSSPYPSREHRIRPVNPAPDPAPSNGPRRRGDLPRPPSPHPDRDRLRDVLVLPPIREYRRPASPHPNRRIIIELPAGPPRSVKSRVPTPSDDRNRRVNRKPKSHSLSEGILPSVDVGGAVGIGDNLRQPPSNYGCTSLEIPIQDGTFLQSSETEVEATGFRHSIGDLFRSFTRRLRGYIAPLLGQVEPSTEVPPPVLPEVEEGSEIATDDSLSTHPSLESGSLYISDLDSSDNSDSETDEFRRPVNVPVTYSSEESLPTTDSDGSPASGSVDNKEVVPSSEDPHEDRPEPDSDQSLSPEGPVDPSVPYSTEVGLDRQNLQSRIEQAAYLAHVNPSGALPVQTTDEAVPEDLYNIRVGSPVDIQIAYQESGNVTTCLRCEPAKYVFDEDGAQSDREDRSDDEVYF